jgi:putative membrane protein insertion efficiency factor
MPSWVTYVLAGIITYLMVRRFVIGCVLIYKVTAPLEVREACRFYPTCSTYMIMAINKYGLIIGITKGIRRLLRCKPPNGGIDYP